MSVISVLAAWKSRGWSVESHGLESRSRVRTVLGSALAVAVILRVGSALYQGDVAAPLPAIYDQISYDTLARQVLAGHGFSFPTDWWPATRAGEPTAHWSFLYTLYLTAVYALFGPHPLAARLVQAIVAGILHSWLTYRIGGRLLGARVGMVAATLSAVYPYFVYYSGALMTETFCILAILWALDLTTGAVRFRGIRPQTPGARLATIRPLTRPWLLLGLALGTATLLRQAVLLFVPFLFAWILFTNSRQQVAGKVRWDAYRARSIAVGLLIATITLLALIAPWTARNYRAFGHFVLLNTNAGYAFFFANHPIQGANFTPILTGSYGDLIPTELRGLDEAALDQALLLEGVRLVVADPGRYALLSLSRIRDYFEFWPSPESSLPSNLARVFSFGVSLPFILYGLFLSVVYWRQLVLEDQKPAVGLLYLFVAVYSVIHLLSWALVRYRLPVDAILILFAALAVRDLGTRLGSSLFGMSRNGAGTVVPSGIASPAVSVDSDPGPQVGGIETS